MAKRHQKVFVTNEPARYQYVPLPRHDWITLETRYHLKLPENVQNQISEICRTLVENSRPSKNLVLWSDVQKKLKNWRDDTKRLRGNIWKHRGPSQTQFEHFQDLIGELFDPTLSDDELLYPLALLDRILEGSIAASEHIEEYMRRWISEHSYETEIWLLWAALVLKHLDQAGNEVKHVTRNQLRSDAPVKLIEKLQASFPDDLRRREGKSLRKAVVAAYKISIRASLRQLNEMFNHWCNGGDLLMARYSEKLKSGQFRLTSAFEKQVALTTRFGAQRRRKQPMNKESLEKHRQLPRPRRIELD